MKKLITILIAALCALLPVCTALAESTMLKTEIPATHTITINCGEHGDVVIDGKTYSGIFTIEVPRLGTLVITADPDSGYGLAQITADDLTGVSIDGCWVRLSSVHSENTLTFRFYELPVIEDGGSGSSDSASGDGSEDVEMLLPEEEAFTPMPEVEDPILGVPTLADVVSIPWMIPTGNMLYDEYLGTGSGLFQTSIVFDGDYQPEDYELLDVFVNDEKQGNSVLVCAFPDEEGKVARRSLILSAAQLVKLAQEQETEHIIFENGDAIAEMDMVDLLGGDLPKLMALILSGKEEITPETIKRDWSLVKPVVIPASQLAWIDVETRIVPVELENSGIGYEISVWLRWGDQELNVSELIPSLTVAITVDALVNENNCTSFAALYTLVYHAPNAQEALPLASTLLLIPDELPHHQDDVAERFVVDAPDEEGEYPVAAYEANAHLVPYRHYALAADYAGEGIYWVQDAK